MILLYITTVIGILVVCILSAFSCLFMLWGILALLEKLFIHLFPGKIGNNTRNNTNAKFPFFNLTIYNIKRFTYINHVLKTWNIFSGFLRYFPTRCWQSIGKPMQNYQRKHRDTEPQKHFESSLVLSHADNLAQEKEHVNQKQTEPSQKKNITIRMTAQNMLQLVDDASTIKLQMVNAGYECESQRIEYVTAVRQYTAQQFYARRTSDARIS